MRWRERLNYRVNKIKGRALYRDSDTLSPTIFKALSMSMPWLQGTAGLARQSPALPLRDTSTRWRRRYRKASAITRMASWVSADVYWNKKPQQTTVRHHCHHADPTAITARLLSPQQCSAYTDDSAADVKSKKIKASCRDWHKNCAGMKAASFQGHAGDKLFRQRLAEKDSAWHVFSGFSRVTNLKTQRKSRERRGIFEDVQSKCRGGIGSFASLTFSGVFLASGNSLSSRRSQRWRNCWTMGLSGLMIWKPVMLAPPEKTLSRLMLEKPWEQRAQVVSGGARDH